MRDAATGLVLAVLMVVLLWQAQSIPGPQFEPLGPRFMAVVVPGLILALALALMVRGLRAAHGDGTLRVALNLDRRIAIAAAVFAALAVYAVLLELRLGYWAYVVSTAAVFTVCGALAVGRVTPRILGLGAAVGFGLAFAVAYVFTEVLYVTLPS